jgi:hypothetical protein
MVPVPGYLDFELARLRTNYLPVLAALGLNRERSQSRHRVLQAAQLVRGIRQPYHVNCVTLQSLRATVVAQRSAKTETIFYLTSPPRSLVRSVRRIAHSLVLPSANHPQTQRHKTNERPFFEAASAFPERYFTKLHY